MIFSWVLYLSTLLIPSNESWIKLGQDRDPWGIPKEIMICEYTTFQIVVRDVVQALNPRRDKKMEGFSSSREEVIGNFAA